MASQTKKPLLRKDTEIFLVGQCTASLPKDVLPVESDILKYYYYLRKLPENSTKSLSDLVCCPLLTGGKESKCFLPGGCSFSEDEKDFEMDPRPRPCVISLVRKRWDSARFPTITVQSMRCGFF